MLCALFMLPIGALQLFMLYLLYQSTIGLSVCAGHGKLFLTGIDIRFDNAIVFIDFSNCLPLIDTAIIGKVH